MLSGPNYHHFHLLRFNELGRVFWAHSLGMIGSSLISLFIPIYLYNLGFPLPEILLFYLLGNLYAIFLQYPMSRVIARFGANRAMAVSTFFHIAYFVLLLTLPSGKWELGLVILPWAIARCLYWAAFHINFSKSRSKENAGRQLGLINAIVTLAHGVTPALGGIAATEFGISWVYGVAIGLFVISVVPLFFGMEVARKRLLKMRTVKWRKIRPDILSNFFNGMFTQSETMVWPLFVFFIVSSYAGVGLLSSVVTLAAIVVSIYVGRREATKGERHYLKEGAGVNTLTSAFRLLAENSGQIFGINLIGGIGHSLFATPFLSRYYEHADEEPRQEYVAVMETVNALGSLLFYVLLFSLSLYFTTSLVLFVGLAMAVPASLGMRLMR